MSPTPPSVLDVATSQLGVSEATGHNDGVPAQRYNRGDELPWCAAFVLYCYDHAGKALAQGSGYYELRSVARMEAVFQARGWWFAPGTQCPQPGDVVFFSERGGSDHGSGRHVGIVESVDDHDVHTIEGNVGNAVRRQQHSLSSSYITGYGRPT